MKVSVLVPFRADDGTPHRVQNWAFLREKWETVHPNWEIIEGACSSGQWIKAVAVEDALSRATGDVIIISDADVWVDGLEDAVGALKHSPWVVPHIRVLRLTEAATQLVLDGKPITGDELDEKPYPGAAGGGMVIMPRALYERVPLDPRFTGWGQEDLSAALAWNLLGGKFYRGIEDLWHFWHPHPPRMNRTIGTRDGRLLFNRYMRASYNPSEMKAILAEFKGVRE